MESSVLCKNEPKAQVLLHEQAYPRGHALWAAHRRLLLRPLWCLLACLRVLSMTNRSHTNPRLWQTFLNVSTPQGISIFFLLNAGWLGFYFVLFENYVITGKFNCIKLYLMKDCHDPRGRKSRNWGVPSLYSTEIHINKIIKIKKFKLLITKDKKWKQTLILNNF